MRAGPPASPQPGRVVVLAGPSGVGKGAVVARVLRALPSLTLSVSATTRRARPEEVDGRDYHFVDEAGFDRMVASGELLEWAPLFGHRSGTPRAPVEAILATGADVLLEVDVAGARQVRATLPSAYLVFLEPPSLEELARRLRSRRTETEEQLARRLARAREEIAAAGEFDAVVVNDDLERAAAQVIDLIRAARAGATTPAPGAVRPLS